MVNDCRNEFFYYVLPKMPDEFVLCPQSENSPLKYLTFLFDSASENQQDKWYKVFQASSALAGSET